MTIVVSSKPHGDIRNALQSIRRRKKMVCKVKRTVQRAMIVVFSLGSVYPQSTHVWFLTTATRLVLLDGFLRYWYAYRVLL